VLYLLIEVPGSIEYFTKSEVLQHFITDAIDNMSKESKETSS